jgi:uncharacterized membrane protein required for colicin V production
VVPGAFDVVALAVGVVGYLLGRSRGLVWQASGLATLVGGGLCATVLSRPLGPLFAEGVAGRFVAWVVVYAVVAICLYVLTIKFKHKIKELEFDELDRRFGAILGTVKALAVFALITIVAAAMAPRLATTVKASFAGRALRVLVNELRATLPEQVHDAFGPWLDAVDAPPAEAPLPARWPESEPAPPAPPPIAPPPVAPPPPAPPVVERAEDRYEVPPPPRPERRTPTPAVDPAPDPFDTSRDPVDPLAPPR